MSIPDHVVPHLGHIASNRKVFIHGHPNGARVSVVCDGQAGKSTPFDSIHDARLYASGLADGLGCHLFDRTEAAA